MDTQVYSLDGGNGLTMYTREYLPEGEPLGAVQIIHGIAEHKERYDPFARFLAKAGYAVYTSDLPGHGPAARLEGSLGLFPEREGWLKVAAGEHAVTEKIRELWPEKPLFLLGHSMGSFLARTCLIRWPGGLAGCILSGTGHQSPALVKAGYTAASLTVKLKGREKPSEMLRKLAFGSYNQRIPDAASPNAWISRDPAIVAAYDADPLCGFNPSAGLLRDMMWGIRLIIDPSQQRKMDPDTPILFISGEEDPVGEYGAGVRRALESFRAAGVKEAEMKLYPGDRHEVLNELDRETVYADVLAWLEAHRKTP